MQARLAWQAPLSVKKMPDLEGEKFYLGYWGFGDDSDRWKDDTEVIEKSGLHAPEPSEQHSNESMPLSLRAAIARHSKRSMPSFQLFGRSIFERDFKCPANTHNCSSIGESNLCCDTGETCVSTSKGVGCCPSGATCGNDVSKCDTYSGYTPCPNSPNGGCCIPGAVCRGVGCVFHGTQTVTTTLAPATETSGASFTTETSSGRVVTVVYPTTYVSVTTTTVTLSPSGYATTQTLIISGTTTQSCRGGYFLCPKSVGGGCCPNGQGCGPDGTCPDLTTSTSATARQPDLPTSVSQDTVSSSTTAIGGCPTGFYMCSARYLGGCCRVDRNCETTSCPPEDSTTLINSGVTVVVTGNGNAQATGGHCANGWSLCGATGGGGCCPTGFQCGRISCIATNPGQDNTLKMAPSSANIVRWAWSFLVLGFGAGAGMVWL